MEELKIKKEKLHTHLSNIQEVTAQRNATRMEEESYKKQQGITDFPFTHGELVEAFRAQAKSEMKKDMRD